jgi:2-keto-4-pentenoate hydratase
LLSETARRLIEARRSSLSARADGANPQDAEDAYAVQDAVALELGWFGDQPSRYWKSGGPSREAVLTHAPLPVQGVWFSPAQAGHWHFHQRGIEVEIALRLARDTDASMARTLDASQAAELIDAMCVSIEVVDSRWREGLDAPPLAKLADLQSHGALVLGDWTAYAPRDWHLQTCRVDISGQTTVVRRGTHSLSDPAFVLPAWLRHVTRQGQRVVAGTVVTTGTWVGILAARAGDLVTAEFEGIGRASVRF